MRWVGGWPTPIIPFLPSSLSMQRTSCQEPQFRTAAVSPPQIRSDVSHARNVLYDLWGLLYRSRREDLPPCPNFLLSFSVASLRSSFYMRNIFHSGFLSSFRFLLLHEQTTDRVTDGFEMSLLRRYCYFLRSVSGGGGKGGLIIRRHFLQLFS